MIKVRKACKIRNASNLAVQQFCLKKHYFHLKIFQEWSINISRGIFFTENCPDCAMYRMLSHLTTETHSSINMHLIYWLRIFHNNRWVERWNILFGRTNSKWNNVRAPNYVESVSKCTRKRWPLKMATITPCLHERKQIQNYD